MSILQQITFAIYHWNAYRKENPLITELRIRWFWIQYWWTKLEIKIALLGLEFIEEFQKQLEKEIERRKR